MLTRLLSLVIAVVALASFTQWAQVANAQDTQVKAQIIEAERMANRGAYASDGVFEGEAEGYGGPIRVAVTIENGYISQVALLSAEHEDAAWLDMAVALLDTIVEEQTTQVDVVSGATFSSSGILNGATRALMASGLAGE